MKFSGRNIGRVFSLTLARADLWLCRLEAGTQLSRSVHKVLNESHWGLAVAFQNYPCLLMGINGDDSMMLSVMVPAGQFGLVPSVKRQRCKFVNVFAKREINQSLESSICTCCFSFYNVLCFFLSSVHCHQKPNLAFLC